MPCLNRHFRIMQIKFTHAFTKNPPHSITHEPFIISRNHIPRCIFRRSMSQHIRISLHIIIPIATLFQIGSRKFPVLCLIFQPCQKASLLFIFRNIQEEFDNNRTILRQIAFIIIYLTIALFPEFRSDIFQTGDTRLLIRQNNLRMYLGNQHILILRTIEYADTPSFRQAPVDTPKIIMVEFFG